MTLTGVQILIGLSKAQLVMGSGQSLLDKVVSERSYVPTNWLDTWVPSKQREPDVILMDVFEEKKLSSNTLGKLNVV
eukprot:9334166-Ditylum_brightwellii.AAC.1